jgi:AraC-like DNA-binding protein
MQHLEFIHQDHFEDRYHRKWASGKLSDYIDFCWETDFEELLADHADGFSDVLFPNIGYTCIINIGTPFIMQLEKQSYEVKSDGFFPRHHYLTCHHSKGNQLFGIKFKVCPVLFEKKVDFSEYKDHVFPLAYLIEKTIVDKVKKAADFNERLKIIFNYYNSLIEKHESRFKYISIVTFLLKQSIEQQSFNTPVDALAASCNISKRSLQRYFEATTSFSTKPALQTIRIRAAVKALTDDPTAFDYRTFGYYDYSHFCKHLKQFTGATYFKDFISVCHHAPVLAPSR